MKYITDASERQDAKRTKEEKYDKARKEAVSKIKKEERKSNKKVTHLTGPHLNTNHPSGSIVGGENSVLDSVQCHLTYR